MTRVDEDRVDKIAVVLCSRFNHVSIRHDYGWPGNSALCVLDCVLSLNRPYDRVVLPRVIGFSKRHPEVATISMLETLLAEYDTVGDFFSTELNYNYVGHERVLRSLVSSMLTIQSKSAASSEWDTFTQWAHNTHPANYTSLGVFGFGLAGFQYLRMMFGVQTTKPDIWIKRFVSEVIGSSVTDLQALMLLEAAAKKAQLPLREVDGAIWEAGARNIS